MTTQPAPQAVPVEVTLPAGWRILRYATLDSTNDEARRLVEAGGAAHGTMVVADRQTAGRGRRGRSWGAVDGNLYLSVVVRSARPRAELGCYAFAVANAAWEAVESETGVRPVLKWPNDLLLEGRKLAGILIEALPPKAEWLVAGIGLNLAGVPQEWAGQAIALRRLCGEGTPTRDRMIAALASRLQAWHERWEREGPAPGVAALRSRTVAPGTAVAVDRRLEGTYAGIADDGSLLVRDASGREHRVTTGDVALLG